ncbi:MAG: M15 family metallopeptidase [Bacilli bacterium]|nr:M15 family metallopeptidase [Bacilli bacterium]
MTKQKIKSIKIKEPYLSIIKVIGVILCILLGLLIFYLKQINDLTKIGYSKEASKNILFSFHKDDVLQIGENKTLNAAFESTDFKEKYMDNYTKINYVNHEHLIKNINKLIKIGYSNNEINIILTHGNDTSVTNFTKKEKVKYLEMFYTVDYAKLDNYDRYLNYENETAEDEELVVMLVNLEMDKEDYQDSILVDKFSMDMLVNKHHYLDKDFEPDNLVKIDKKYASESDLKCNKEALNAFIEMSKACESAGLGIVINSAYRSYEDQVDISNLYLNSYGQAYVDKFVAKPGYSEHQTGLAFDIGSRSVNVFANSKEYEWMLENAYKYGFIFRFAKKYEDITGFRSEPWHYRYVGKKAAKIIHDDDMTLEEYFVKYLDK